jgi:hypothetical protein
MTTLEQSQVISVSAPALPFYAITPDPPLDAIGPQAGMLADPHELSFQIWDLTTDAKRLKPVQLFPSTAGQRSVLNTSEMSSARAGPGRFVPLWTVPANATVGRYEVRWFWKQNEDDLEKTARKTFEVVAGAGIISQGRGYLMTCELRDEGIDTTTVSDVRLQETIVLAEQMIEQYTGRVFVPVYCSHTIRGTGARAIILGDPIVGIESVAITTTPYASADLTIDSDLFRIQNRHLRGVRQPDDRESPRIEFVHGDDLIGIGGFRPSVGSLRSLQFPGGTQNITVTGLFGYTDQDSSPWGCTPKQIVHLAKLFVFREMGTVFDDLSTEMKNKWRITQERTRDQAVTVAAPPAWTMRGGITGDPEIDRLLFEFGRPPAFGAV